jgi:DNA repair exonuclease SbcCD nuclease subunit
MSLTIVSDWHLGAVRSGGTTPATAYQLRQDLLANGEEILYDTSGDLLINGDLFDGPDINKADLLRALQIFGDWLQRNPGSMLLAANGNHDLAKSSLTFSAYQFFVALLIEMYGPERVKHITEGTYIKKYDTYVIPHVANSDLFDLEISRVPSCTYLCVHANYDNGFAVESDHSLNMSQEQAQAVPAEHIIFGHEHQARTELGGKVVIVGNQFPSSVSDCLNNERKQYARISDEGLVFETSWASSGDFAEIDWRELEDTGARFIRVVGNATAAEAGAAVTAISRFRNTSKALVITNAVKVQGVDDAAQLVLSHEQITSFNVRDALREYLTDDENQKIDSLKELENA